jgi:hypothetical protein
MSRLDEFLREHQNLERGKRPRLYIRVDEVPRTLAKRTKIWPRLRELIQGVELSGEGATTLTAYRQAPQETRPAASGKRSSARGRSKTRRKR